MVLSADCHSMLYLFYGYPKLTQILYYFIKSLDKCTRIFRKKSNVEGRADKYGRKERFKSNTKQR